MTDQMDVEVATSQKSTRDDAPDKKQDAQAGGSIVDKMETGEEGHGWQEVRGRRAEKRAQGGSTGASPAKPEAQRRAVEASVGGSIAQQEENSGPEGSSDSKQGPEAAGAAREAQQQRPRAAAPTGSWAARRAKQVGGSIVGTQSPNDASTISGGRRDDSSESEESERSRGNTTTSSAGQLGRQLEKATVEDGPAQVSSIGSSSSSSVATLCAGHASKGLADHRVGVTHSTSERLHTFTRSVVLVVMLVCVPQLQQARANLKASYAAQVRPSTQLIMAPVESTQGTTQQSEQQEGQSKGAQLALPAPAETQEAQLAQEQAETRVVSHKLLSCQGNEIAFTKSNVTTSIVTELREGGFEVEAGRVMAQPLGATGPYVVTVPLETEEYMEELGSILLVADDGESASFMIKSCTPDGRPLRQARSLDEAYVDSIRAERWQKRTEEKERTVLLMHQLPLRSFGKSLERGELEKERGAVRAALDLAISSVRVERVAMTQAEDGLGELQPAINTYVTFPRGAEAEAYRSVKWNSLRYIQFEHGARPICSNVPARWVERLDLAACCYRPKSVCPGGCAARADAFSASGALQGQGPEASVSDILRQEKQAARVEKRLRAEEARAKTKAMKSEALCSDFKGGEVRNVSSRKRVESERVVAHASGPAAVSPCWGARVHQRAPQALPMVEEPAQWGTLPLNERREVPDPRERMPILWSPHAVGRRSRRVAGETQVHGQARVRVPAGGRAGRGHRTCRGIIQRAAKGAGALHALRGMRHAGERSARVCRRSSPCTREREGREPGEGAGGRRVRAMQRHEVPSTFPGSAAESSRIDRKRRGDPSGTPTASRRCARMHSRRGKRGTCGSNRTRRITRRMSARSGSRSHLNLYLVQRMRWVRSGPSGRNG